MGFENGNPFFGEDHPIWRSDVESVENVYRENGDVVEGLADINGHRRKVVGKGGSVRCGGAWTKGEGREC